MVSGKRGKRRKARLNDDGDRILVEGGSYLIAYANEHGQRVQESAGTTDRDVAQQIAAKFEGEVALRKRGLIDPAMERFSAEARRPIGEHVAEFRGYLTAKQRTPQHVTETCRYIEVIIAAIGAKGPRDLRATAVMKKIGDLRDEGASLRTCNAHITAIKALARWLWRERRIPDDPLCSLSLFNTQTDQRHVRRELTPEELAYLLAFVETRTKPGHTLPGPDRAMLYRVAAGTGFRTSELRSLTLASFELGSNPPTITVEAAYSKHRRQDVQPIRQDLAQLLERWLQGRPSAQRVFPRVSRYMSRTLHADLDAARAAWIGEPQDEAARRDREQSQFLRYRDADDRVIDFHALRHTYISGIVAGGASVKTAQTLARHSDPSLTIGRYSHARLHDLTGALEALPEAEPTASQLKPKVQELATGTDGHQMGSKWPPYGHHPSGETGQNVAQRGKRSGIVGAPDSADLEPDSEAEPVTLSLLDNKKATSGKTWHQAEGTGLEPATGKPAPDFESGC